MNAIVFRCSLPRMAAGRLLGALSPGAYFGPWAPIRLENIPEPTLPADDWLLVRTARCGICGKAYSGVTIHRRGRDYQYYVCNQRNPIPGEQKCPSSYVPLPMLETAVWDVITGVVQNPPTLESEHQSRPATT